MIKKRPVLFILFFFLSIANLVAQPGGPGNGPPNPPGPVDDIPAPIDDHLILLVLVAVTFGLYFILSKRSSAQQN